ncbi:MAG: hypothetical protein P4L87_21985 [Formivibrio sp.]|nr:hypothetical protein [Formivibrio sp.]
MHKMNTSQPDQPIVSARPIDWSQGIECRFFQLSAVLAKAKAAGYHASLMVCIRGGYRLTFQREATLHQVEAKRPAQANMVAANGL